MTPHERTKRLEMVKRKYNPPFRSIFYVDTFAFIFTKVFMYTPDRRVELRFTLLPMSYTICPQSFPPLLVFSRTNPLGTGNKHTSEEGAVVLVYKRSAVISLIDLIRPSVD